MAINYSNRYKARMYDMIHVLLPKGKKEEYALYAESLGMSLNEMTRVAVKEYLDEKREYDYTLPTPSGLSEDGQAKD